MEDTADASLAAMRECKRLGIAMAAIISMIAITINNSISVNPRIESLIPFPSGYRDWHESLIPFPSGYRDWHQFHDDSNGPTVASDSRYSCCRKAVSRSSEIVFPGSGC